MLKNVLTERRQAILDYIERFTSDHGYPPTVREIGAGVGLTSSSSVHYNLRLLEKGGYIERDGTLTRALRSTKAPSASGSGPTRYAPLVGKVAAGTPILATENIEDNLPLPVGLFPQNEVFMLRVTGDSMIKAGIMDGDLVVVQPQATAENGEIVVALLDDEATVKRFFQHDHAIELRPENDLLEPIITSEVRLVGKVCGIVRTYS
jgi:repressor LexA